MERLAQYESDSDSVATTVVDSESETTVADSISTLEDTQLVEELQDTQPAMTSAQPVETQPAATQAAPALVNVETDYLPPRDGLRFIGQVSEPQAPKGVKGWNMEKLQAAIRHCRLPGLWRQGGQLNRGVFEGVSEHGHYIIIWHAGTWWCQGKAAKPVHMQLLASQGSLQLRAAQER